MIEDLISTKRFAHNKVRNILFRTLKLNFYDGGRNKNTQYIFGGFLHDNFKILLSRLSTLFLIQNFFCFILTFLNFKIYLLYF